MSFGGQTIVAEQIEPMRPRQPREMPAPRLQRSAIGLPRPRRERGRAGAGCRRHGEETGEHEPIRLGRGDLYR
jgi:hypothetical protein